MKGFTNKRKDAYTRVKFSVSENLTPAGVSGGKSSQVCLGSMARPPSATALVIHCWIQIISKLRGVKHLLSHNFCGSGARAQFSRTEPGTSRPSSPGPSAGPVPGVLVMGTLHRPLGKLPARQRVSPGRFAVSAQRLHGTISTIVCSRGVTRPVHTQGEELHRV